MLPGPAELLVIALVLVVFVGPSKLAETFKSLAKLFLQVKKQTDELKSTVNDAVKNAEKELELEDVKKMKDKIIDITKDIKK